MYEKAEGYVIESSSKDNFKTFNVQLVKLLFENTPLMWIEKKLFLRGGKPHFRKKSQI